MSETEWGIRYSFVQQQADLYEQALRLRYKVFFEPFSGSMDYIFDSMEKDSFHLVANLDALAVAYGRLTINDKTAQISQMVVSELFQKKGIGSQMMQILIGKALELGVYLVFLNSKTDATNFYSKFGFYTVGQDFSSPKTGSPHIRMERKWDKK